MSNTDWPEGVIARYTTLAAVTDPTATVDVIDRPGCIGHDFTTETAAVCHGCGAEHIQDWGFSPWEADFMPDHPQPDFDESGDSVRPFAHEWAQEHAAACRALPKPDGAR